MAETEEGELQEAGQIFLLMKKDYRISRNVRLAWFISHLLQPVCAVPEAELGLHDDELEVVSIIPHGWQPDEPVPPGPYLLVPSTWVTFLARQYRFVIELDLSPSTGIVDDSTEEIIFDEIFHSLSRCLLGLLRPFRIPGSNILFRPEIFVTIQAYSSIIGLQSHQVLVQGCQLEEQKLQDFLQQVHVQLGAFENKVAEMLQQHYRSMMDDIPQYGDQPSGGAGGVSLVSPDVGLVSMIRQGILALQLLPANSSAGIIVITDGVTSVPDVAVCETLLNQLRSSTIACSFVQVGGVYSYDCSFGYIPNVELMKFIAMATLGSYLSSCPELEPGLLDINVYHKAFLLYSFLRTSEALNPEYYCVSQHKLFNEHLVSASSNPALTMRRRKHADKEIHADLISVASVRLREGYSIRELRISKGVLEMKLVLLWKHNMRVEYLAMAPWPLDPSKRSTRVEVVMEGSYDILHDISCTLKKPITSMYRTGVIRRFWNTLQSITQTDQMLVHLKSFDTVPEHFKIPESTKNGVPLFYIPPGSTTPVLSLQHSGGSESFRSQFASYWKPILSMDANFWQRWLHVHRIVLLLEHDMPVPKHLHTPGNNGRYSTVLCRISHTTLTSLLRDWSSFVLVEGYSYVKLMLSDVNQPPASFCVVRIIWKAPCMVLRLGFPLGTSAHSRNKILEELRDCILQLRFPHRVQSKETTPRVKRKMFGISSPSKSPPPLLPSPALSDRPCLVLLHKPLEKLLIKYDKLPLDFRTPFVLNLESPTQNPSVPAPLTTNRSASSTLASLSRYFYHQRWIWSVQSALGTSLSTAAMAQILSTLTEIRLSEGFHFASSGDGIINMVLEVPVQSDPPSEGSIEKHSCIIQYILFPPNISSTKDSFSTDEDNDTEVEAIEQDAELHLVSECWVEPQSGHVMSSGGSWRHLHGLTYPEIPQALFPRDQSCIGVMLTFENIVQLCQNKDRTSPIPRKAESAEPPLSSGPCVHEVPFHFDLMKLLPKCQQIEMFLLTLSKESEETSSEASIPNDMLMSLFHGCLLNDINDREIPLYGQDHVAFMEQVLHRDREGHASPFSFSPDDLWKNPIRTQVVESSPKGADRDGANSACTVQSPGSAEMMEDGGASADAEGPPQWRCYARMVNPQHLLLTFIPATFSDIQKLTSLDMSVISEGNASQPEAMKIPTFTVTPAPSSRQEGEMKRETLISFSRQPSLQDAGLSHRLRCPVYVYNCPLDALREQLVTPLQHRPSGDVFFRSQSLDRASAGPSIHPRQKELVNYCNVLQEHYHQCYVKGMFKALQQGLWVSNQDLLTAVDYCEEQLQEIDITNFLRTLCGHLRTFRESHPAKRRSRTASFRIGSLEQEDDMSARDGATLQSESSVDTEECSEQEPQVIPTPNGEDPAHAGFPLSLLETGHPCEVSPDLHRIIQDKFLAIGSLHFKTVPTNPHYFFYCPSPPKRAEDPLQEEDRKLSEDLEVSDAELAVEEGTLAGGIMTESDPDLEVEYREHSDHAVSLSESDTVNQDDDSFSVLGGESLNGQDLSELEMPPLFVHLICSVSHKSQHGSMAVLTLPTCLGQVISCLENSEAQESIALGELGVMLDIYVLTLPLDIEGVNGEAQHTRYTSESSVSFPRSPAQPSSYRSDEEIPPALERFPSTVDPRYSALSRLPAAHRQAIEVTMCEIRWLLEDELVSALRHSSVITRSVLQKVLTHVCDSEGRPHCHRELVQLQFVFGPEHSLQKFKEEFRRLSLSGYQLNEEEEDYYYVSMSRHHAHRVGSTANPHLHMETNPPWQESDTSASNECPEDGEAKLPPADTHSDKVLEEALDMGLTAEVSDSDVSSVISGISAVEQGSKVGAEQVPGEKADIPPKTSSVASLPDSLQSGAGTSAGGPRQRPSRVQSLVSSHGSMDSDHLGYDGGSSDSECGDALISEQDSCRPLMPDFWLIVKIQQDRVEVCTHTSVGSSRDGTDEVRASESLHQLVVRKVGEICRVVNQRLLLQDLHDTHLCNSLLVAESEEDIWKSESPYATYRHRTLTGEDYSGEESYQPRDYLAATMHFMPGHFACEVVWRTVIHIHPRLKMGPNIGVSRAIQSLRSVLNAFSVVNRKNMFVYQERSTKAVFYLRLSETSGNGRSSEMDLSQSMMSRSLALSRSQEPISSEDVMGSRLSLDLASSRSMDSSRPVGQMDKHILLHVHGVGEAGSEITDDLVKVLRKRLDETTLDIITVMLQRNCKLTPADVEFIQPRGTPPTEVLLFTVPQSSLSCLQAMAYYLRQNLLIFLHTPKYTDSNGEHHFQHYYHSDLPELDLFLYNKPGGQGTGGKGIACIALSFVDQHGSLVAQAYLDQPLVGCSSASPDLMDVGAFDSLTEVKRFFVESCPSDSAPLTLVRFDVWEKGNISSSQLSERLCNSMRHALCDVIIEYNILQSPMCVEPLTPAAPEAAADGRSPSQSLPDMKRLGQSLSKTRPSPINIPLSVAASSAEPSTPPSKTGRRSFWDMLSKPDIGELGPPKTTDDIVSDRPEELRTRRRHKTDSLKTLNYSDKSGIGIEQRKRQMQLEEGDVGSLHPLYSHTCLQWMNFMNQLGCPSVQLSSASTVSRFLVPSILLELFTIITSLACDTSVRVFEKICGTGKAAFVPYSPSQQSAARPAAARELILLGRNFHQWRYNSEQAQKGSQRFEALDLGAVERALDLSCPLRGLVPRQRFLLIEIQDKKLTLYTYNWSPDLGASLSRSLVRLVQWQNARSHVVHCLLSQKRGLFHHCCFAEPPLPEDIKQDPNPFLNSTLEVDAVIRSPTPPPHKEQIRLGASGRSLQTLHFPPEMLPFDEVLRDVMPVKPMHLSPEQDTVSRHGAQFLEIKSTERREVEKQLKIENLFVTWQQRSAQSNMPISAADLDTLKQSARLVHYCATPLLFDPTFQSRFQNDQGRNEGKKRHRSNDSAASGRDRSYSCDSAEMPSWKVKDEPWLQELCTAFMQQYIQYLQSTGFILVQLRPASPARSMARIRATQSLAAQSLATPSHAPSSLSTPSLATPTLVTDSRTSKPKNEGSPKSGISTVTTYHLQRALPGGIVLMELSFQGCYFCVKQHALECSRIPMGQSVNSQLSMLFTEECDKVRDLMHVHSFSYDFHLRVLHQYLLGSHMTLRQGYDLASFLQLFISQHPDIPKYGRNHVYQGMLSISTGMIAAHQLYNYIADHASAYHMKPLRMSRPAAGSNGKKSAGGEQNEYGLVSIWNSSGMYNDSEGLRHHDDFDVSLLVCHNAVPFEEQSEQDRHVLRLRYYVIMTSQRELFPRLTADMRRFKKPPRLQRDADQLAGAPDPGKGPRIEMESREDAGAEEGRMGGGNLYNPLLANEVKSANRQLEDMVKLAKSHCRRDNLWKRLYLMEPLASDKLKLGKLSSSELQELLDAVHGRSVAEIDPQLEFLLSMSVQWYQSLIKVLLSRFPQSCRHFFSPDSSTQYLVVLNQKFTDCFILVFLDSHSGKTSLKVVFREPFPEQPQNSESPLPQLVSTYHHLESVINTACFNLWSGLL